MGNDAAVILAIMRRMEERGRLEAERRLVSEDDPRAYSIYRSSQTDKVVVRRRRRDADDPSSAQAAARERFARAAREANGQNGLVDGIPAAAAAVRDRTRGRRYWRPLR